MQKRRSTHPQKDQRTAERTMSTSFAPLQTERCPARTLPHMSKSMTGMGRRRKNKRKKNKRKRNKRRRNKKKRKKKEKEKKEKKERKRASNAHQGICSACSRQSKFPPRKLMT
jgi:hypothetical protein